MRRISKRNTPILVEANDTLNARATIIPDVRCRERGTISTIDKAVPFFKIIDFHIFYHAGGVRNEIQSRELIPEVLGHLLLL